jgi:hypothetical protein
MSESAPANPTVEEAEQRLSEINRHLSEVVPQLQTEILYLQGYLAGLRSGQDVKTTDVVE